MPRLGKVFCVLSLLILTSDIPIQAANAKSCVDVEFIFARGSGESLGDKNMQAWRQEIINNLGDSNLKYDFYELGSQAQDGFQYPAVAVSGSTEGYANLVGAVVSGGESLEFGSSVINGSYELQHYISKRTNTCPGTKFVLGGYSQGAMLVSRTLDKIDASSVVYVSTFGDPKLYLPEGKGIIPSACLGHNHSNYRVYVPDCHAYEGVLGSYRPYQPAEYIDKLGTWCNTKDIMCSSGMSLKDHTSYVSDQIYTQSARVIVEKLKLAFSEKVKPLETTKSTEHNLAIIIDSSGSMSRMIDSYKAEAKRLAKRIFESGGKVALYEYRDLDDPFEPVQLCDYSCTFAEFSAKLETIYAYGGGDDDESALSAILYALNTLEWKVGATKSIVLLTDAKYLSPDRDGTTLAEVTKRSLEIDPVNIYTITTKDNQEFYEELAKATNGKVFNIDAELSESSDTILGRPYAFLPNSAYTGLVGDKLYFDASNSYSLLDTKLSYDWDLDVDGVFEHIDVGPTIEQTYLAAVSGFIQVRVRDTEGNSSTMSAKLDIRETLPTVPKIEALSASPLDQESANITFSTDAEQVLVIIDELVVGFLEAGRRSFVLNNIYTTHTVSLVPYRDGMCGESQSISVSPKLPTAPSAGKGSFTAGIWSQYQAFRGLSAELRCQ